MDGLDYENSTDDIVCDVFSFTVYPDKRENLAYQLSVNSGSSTYHTSDANQMGRLAIANTVTVVAPSSSAAEVRRRC